MATTTNYAWETPDDTDLVKDGAAAIRTLGSSIDTTTKALNPSTTTGDIEYRSATANTNARLALGTAGQVLTVNSGATAPEWATPTAPAAAALVLTGSADFTTSSAVNINNCFSATYNNYHVEIDLTAVSATDAEFHARMRASGTDNTASSYFSQWLQQKETTVGGAGYLTRSMFHLGSLASSKVQQLAWSGTLKDPFNATNTKMLWHVWMSNSSDAYQNLIVGHHAVNTSYDGITFYPAAGTITGKIRIYGYSLS